MMIPLILASLQFFPPSIPPTQAEQSAELALLRAGEGRALARRFRCGDEARARRLAELDAEYARLHGSFAKRFGYRQGQDVEGEGPLEDGLQAEVGRRDDCRLRDAFAAGMIDYENGLLAVRAALAARR